jgi:hypothetical protein
MPELTVRECGGVVRLSLGGVARGEGASLQDAADDLIRRLLSMALAFRSTGFTISPELSSGLEMADYLYELAEIAAAGGDIRSRVFG